MNRFHLLIIATVLVLVPTLGQGQVNLDSGLVAYYPFDGNADDASGNGNHGITYGMVPTSNRFGNSGLAYEFNGQNSWINMGDDPSLHMFDSTSMTFFAWIYAEPPHRYGDIMRYDDGDGSDGDVIYNRYLYLLRTLPTGRLNFEFGNPNFNNNFVSLSSDSVLKTAQWHSVAAVRNVSTDSLCIYIDGKVKKCTIDPTVGKWETTGQYLMVGRYSDITQVAHFFKGKMDDLRIYRRALSQEEIIQLENERSTKLQPLPTIFFSLSPNPSTGIFHLRASLDRPQRFSLTILNALGQVVWEQHLAEPLQEIDQRIDLGELPSGVYHLRVEDGQRSMSYKLVLEP